jgi:peptidylprolyl isomerase
MMTDRRMARIASCALLCAASQLFAADPPAPKAPPGMAEILAASPAGDWRALMDEHTMYLQLPAGRVIIEMDPALSPHAVAAIEALVRMHYFDNAAVVRVQDNFVAQWVNPDTTRKLPDSMLTLAPEFTAPIGAAPFTVLPDRDGFAPEVGFVDGFAAARDPKAGRMWLAHCYGAVGIGRDNDPATGNGAELYAVIGHAPRQLDRNVTVVGRVRQGMELLATLPRGTEALGYYAKPSENVPISRVVMAGDLPAAERTRLQVLRTDSKTFQEVVEARRNRTDTWYINKAGYIDLCNAPIPVRPAP